MTDKEFKQLSRAQLIDVIYQLQLQNEELADRSQKLEKALFDKHLRISTAGSLAEAALEINNCFTSAQKAADQYLTGIKAICDETEVKSARILDEARAEAERTVAKAKAEAEEILEKARTEAGTIVAEAKRTQDDYDFAVETILKEYKHKHPDYR